MKTKLTKLQRDIYQFCSPSGIRPALNCVLFNGVRAVATDSFRLVETTKLKTTGEAIPDTLIQRDSLKAIKLLKADTSIDVDTVNGQVLATPDAKKSGTYKLETNPNDESAAGRFECYPKYQTIIDDAEKRKYTEVVVHGEYLAEIAAYLAKFQGGRIKGAIKLRVPLEKNQAVIIEARSETEKGYALLMPIQEK